MALSGKLTDKERAFAELRKILYRWAPAMDVVKDEEASYFLDTRHIMKNKKALNFGSVSIKKTYVSFHLMPVYVNPELLADMTPELKKRMQGKSCFNFKAPDAALFGEIKTLTRRCYEDYVRQGYIGK